MRKYPYTTAAYGKTRDAALISAAAQRILDRIIFLRICEEFGFEELGTLLDMGLQEDGFWPLFLEQHEKRYAKIYDGILFPATGEDDPSGVDSHLRSWWLKGRIFREIATTLYYPNPYRFDVVPVELLGGIYERYLGKRLRIVGNEIDDEYKQETQRTKGAVYTPPWVVRRVVDKALSKIIEGKDPDRILNLKVLDPACGSASFLLGVYDYLEECIFTWFEKNPRHNRRPHFITETVDGPRLQPHVVRGIIDHCIYGVDIDAEAVEVARMSLALRYLERTAALGIQPELLLQGIGLNVRQGNSLVGPDIMGNGIGAEKIIKEAMPFMEQGLRLMKKDGRLAFIIQNRFFKTDYGETVRSWLKSIRAVEEIEDFRDLQVFAGRTTYTSIIVLRRNSPSVRYRTYASIDDAVSRTVSVECDLSWDKIDSEVWSFDQPDLLEVHDALRKKHGAIGQHPEIQISVGLQTLYGKLYQFEPVDVKPRTVVGRNGDGETVVLEKAALRPLCRNRGFYPFRKNNADAWVIFPYEIENGEARELLWKEFKERFPKTAAYLEERKKKLLQAIDAVEGINRWHLYRYPKNLVNQTRSKVLFPTTIEDTIASVDSNGDVYQDNVRINSLVFTNSTDLMAIAALINSSLFNSLALLKAGLSDNNWRQLNKQFISLVPFPRELLDSSSASVKKLSTLATQISNLQPEFLSAETEGEKSGIRSTLDSLWNKLDAVVEELYGLSAQQKAVVKKGMKRYSRLQYFEVAVKKEIIFVFLADQDVDALMDMLKTISPMVNSDLNHVLDRSLTYSPMLRFILIEDKRRIFMTQRYCSLGSIDDWIDVGRPGYIQNLVRKYVGHLGKESFYNLI